MKAKDITTDAHVITLLVHAKVTLQEYEGPPPGLVPRFYPYVDRDLGIMTANAYQQRGYLAASGWVWGILAYQEYVMGNPKKAYTYACRAYEKFNRAKNALFAPVECDEGMYLQDAELPEDLRVWWADALAQCYNEWSTRSERVRKPWLVYVTGSGFNGVAARYASHRAAIGRAEELWAVYKGEVVIEIDHYKQDCPTPAANPYTYLKNSLKVERKK